MKRCSKVEARTRYGEHRVEVEEVGERVKVTIIWRKVCRIENLGEIERFVSARSPGGSQFPNAAASVLVSSRRPAGGGGFVAEGAPRERLDHSRPGRRPPTIRSPFTCATVACVPCYRS